MGFCNLWHLVAVRTDVQGNGHLGHSQLHIANMMATLCDLGCWLGSTRREKLNNQDPSRADQMHRHEQVQTRLHQAGPRADSFKKRQQHGAATRREAWKLSWKNNPRNAKSSVVPPRSTARYRVDGDQVGDCTARTSARLGVAGTG